MQDGIIIVVLVLVIAYILGELSRSEMLAGHLRTDRLLWQLEKKPTYKSWPTNGYEFNANPPPTTWHNNYDVKASMRQIW